MTTAADEIVEQQFEVGAGAELSVKNISGRINVGVGAESVIAVRARKYGRDRAVENTRVEIFQDGNRVEIRTRAEEDGGWLSRLGGQVCAVDYDVVVPEGCRVLAKAVSADLTVRGTNGEVRAESVSGDIEVVGTRGECRISSVSGDATCRDVDGTLSLNTTSGDAAVEDSRIERFNCHTVSGDLTVETPLTTGGHYLAHTVSGDLRLLVPPGTGATIQMKSVSGNVRSDLPAEIIKAGRRHWQGRINGGGANVEMHTVSGDLEVSISGRPAGASSSVGGHEPRSVESDAPAIEAPGVDVSAQPETATAVLEQLEQGAISVEEAMARLKALR